MYDIFNPHVFPIVHTGIQYTEQFLSDCVDNGYTWCGSFAASPIRFRKMCYLGVMEHSIEDYGDDLCIFLNNKCRAFYFVCAGANPYFLPEDRYFRVEYEDLKADFSDFDSIF